MRNHHHPYAAALTIGAAGLLVLTGCSSDESASAEATGPTVQVTSTPTPEPSPTEEADALKIGETADLSDVQVTVHEIDLDPAPDGPQPDRASDKWVAVDMELCTEIDSSVSNMPWSIVDSENHRFTASSVGYETFPEPEYAFGELTLYPGECVRGWTTFVVNQDADLQQVTYRNPSGATAQWNISH